MKMAEVAIRPFHPQHLPQLPNVITGYVTHETYAVEKNEQNETITFSLTLRPLPTPKTITYDHLDKTELARLAKIVTAGLSLGAFVGEQLVG